MSKKIWFDITNTPQVHFLLGIKSILPEEKYNFEFSTRNFSETVELLEKNVNTPFKIIGSHKGKNKLMKAFGLLSRFIKISTNYRDYDISISCGSENAIWNSYLRRKTSVAFGDNDQAKQWTYSRFVDYAFFPNAISQEALAQQGLHTNKIYQYDGFKEDIYIANYNPDPDFLQSIPFNKYVLVRPENIFANYIRNKNARSITPVLLKLLEKKGFNILYLPRYKIDYTYAKGITSIHIPESSVNGLDACYFADAVLTGAGTLAREAACLGVPSFSFYAGEKLLAVDRKLIAEKKVYFSRDPGKLVDVLIYSHKKEFDLNRSKMVQKEVKEKLINILDSL